MRIELEDEALATTPGLKAAVAVHQAVVQDGNLCLTLGQEFPIDVNSSLCGSRRQEFLSDHFLLRYACVLGSRDLAEVDNGAADSTSDSETRWDLRVRRSTLRETQI